VECHVLKYNVVKLEGVEWEDEEATTTKTIVDVICLCLALRLAATVYVQFVRMRGDHLRL
jgi:hypothetical protein